MSCNMHGYFLEGNTFYEPEGDVGNYHRPHHHPPCEPPHRGPIVVHPPIINRPCECIEHDDCGHHCLHPTHIIDFNDDWHKPYPPQRYDIPSIINIETKLIITLQITLYGAKEEDDVTLILSEGKTYEVCYITEEGVFKIKGMLTTIDTSIPIREYQYIGNTEPIASSAYLIFDCSNIGKSDVKKVFINSIRSIEEVAADVQISDDLNDIKKSLTNLNSYVSELNTELENIKSNSVDVYDYNAITEEVEKEW